MVIPAKQKGRFYVLDGNRRLTALRMLERPNLVKGLVDDAKFKKIKALSAQYKSNPIRHLQCIVFKSRDDANIWIQLTHRGQSQGAGLVEWDGQVAARYDERSGIGERGASTALQILEVVKDDRKISQTTRDKIENGKFPITNLTRLINTPYIRKKIGLDAKVDINKNLESKTFRSLVQIVEDFGSEYKTVSDIKRLSQRIEYIDRLFEPRPAADNKTSSTQATKTTTSQTSTNNKSSRKEEKPRNTIIPKDFLAEISQPRINRIFVELKKLNVDELSNAGSVLLRVFLELSLDHYLEETIKWPEQQVENSTLSQKLTAVANDLERKQIMSPKQLAPIRKAAGGQTLLVASIKTLHGYVHNKYFSPIPSELRTTWDDIALFITKLWPI